MIRRVSSTAVGVSAAVAELIAALVGFSASGVAELLLALAFHVCAATLAVRAARGSRVELFPSERQAVFLTAFLLPLLGPVVAWTLPHPDDRAADLSSTTFREYFARVRPAVVPHDRTVLTGSERNDVQTETAVRSHRWVLRTGSRIERLNALECLARSGRPSDFALIRSCLGDADEEVRLFAYSRLAQVADRLDDLIVAAKQDTVAEPDYATAATRLARAHFDLAASGVLDPQTSVFQYRSAARAAVAARALDSRCREALLLAMLATARTEDHALHADVAKTLGQAEAEDSDVRIAMAEVAFRRRDVVAVRAIADELLDAGVLPPTWLVALASPGRLPAAAWAWTDWSAGGPADHGAAAERSADATEMPAPRVTEANA